VPIWKEEIVEKVPNAITKKTMKTDRGETLLSVQALKIYLLTLISKRRNITSARAGLIFSAWRLVFGVFLVLITTAISYAQQEIDNCFNYMEKGDYERAVSAGRIAVKLYPDNVASYLCLGRAYYIAGEIDSAFESIKEAERLATDRDDLITIYNILGNVYGEKDDLDNALFYYNRCLFLSRELGDKKAEVVTLDNMGTIYQKQRAFEKALYYYEQSLGLLTDEKDKASTYNNIALVYGEKDNYKKAVEYLKKAMEIYESTGDYYNGVNVRLNLGDTYRRAKDFDSAFEELNKGLKIAQRIGDKFLEARGYKYLGWFYIDKGEIQKAEEYLIKAYKLFDSIGARAEADSAAFSLFSIDKEKDRDKKNGEGP